jgi:hypothetical protein
MAERQGVMGDHGEETGVSAHPNGRRAYPRAAFVSSRLALVCSQWVNDAAEFTSSDFAVPANVGMCGRQRRDGGCRGVEGEWRQAVRVTSSSRAKSSGGGSGGSGRQLGRGTSDPTNTTSAGTPDARRMLTMFGAYRGELSLHAR